MFAKPTFWEKDVIGVHPNRPAKEEMKPSHDIAAPISTLCGLRFNEPLHKALVSPIVSVAETGQCNEADILETREINHSHTNG